MAGCERGIELQSPNLFHESGITYLQRTITLPDDVRVRGSHSVTIDEPGRYGSPSILELSTFVMSISRI